MKSLKNLVRLNAVIIILTFLGISLLMFYISYQSASALDEKELSLLLQQEKSVLDQKILSYQMTLESVQSLLNQAIQNQKTLDVDAIHSVALSLISNQPYVYSLFYALEPRFARSIKGKDYYIHALLKNSDLVGTEAYSEKQNIKAYEYFDGDYYKNPQGTNQIWYHAAKNNSSLFLTRPYFDAPYLKLTIFTAVLRLTDSEGQFAGIVGMDIPLMAFFLENAKRTSALHYRTLIADKAGNALEGQIVESDFKYPEKYMNEGVFKINAKNIKIPPANKFKLRDEQGNHYTAFAAPVFNDTLRLAVVKSRNSTAVLSNFFKEIILAIVILLPLQLLLTQRASEKIYSNVRALFVNFQKNIERVRVSRDLFTPVHIDKKLDYSELEEVRRMWNTFLFDFNKTLKEVKTEKDKSVKALEFQSTFIASMSHEIRTPMNAIMGMVDLMMDTPLSEKQKEILKIFSSSSENLLALLNDILDLAKIESGSMKLEYIKTDLEKIRDDSIMLFREKASGKNLEFVFEIDKDVNAKVKTDPVRLKQIIFNLIGNAIKFTEKGKILVRIRNHKDNTRRGTQKIVLLVEDTGIGIPKEKTKSIFEKFTQADASTTRKYGGSGLGLSIVKSLSLLMGGSVKLRSKLGCGSIFIVTLPVEFYQETHVPALALPAEREVAPVSDIYNDFKILAVDDVKENRLLLKMYAKYVGIDCELAENGKQAVELAKQNTYNLIILDIQMPIMDGPHALKEIRALENSNSLSPILAFSAFASKDDEQKYLDEGFNEYLTKPLSKKQFADCMMKYIEKSQYS